MGADLTDDQVISLAEWEREREFAPDLKPKHTFLGKPLVLSTKYPEGEVHMHPETLYQLTGCRPEGHRVGEWIVLK